MKKSFTLLLLIALILPFGAIAESYDLDDLLALGAENNDQIVNALRDYNDALEASEEIYDIDSIQLGVNGSYSINSDQELGYSASLSVPVLSQASLSGSINQNGSGSAGLKLQPFISDLSDQQENETLKKASYQYKQILFSLESDITQSLISYSQALINLEIAREENELAEKNYKIALKQYELDDINYEDLLDAQQSAAEATQTFTQESINLLTAEQELKLLVGPADKEYTPVPLTEEELLSISEGLKKVTQEYKESQAASLSLLNYQAELESLVTEQKKTMIYQPDLSVSADYAYPDSSISIGVSLGFSLADINTDEKEELDYQITSKQTQISNEIYNQELSLSSALKNIEISESAYAIAKNNYEQSQIQLKEAEYLYKTGERTTGELMQAKISLLSSQKNLYSALAGIINARYNYLSHFFSAV